MPYDFLKISWSVWLCLCVWIAHGADTLSLPQLIDMVQMHHPLIKKAELYDDIQAAHELARRGVLDPSLASDYQSKFFQNKNYFTLWQAEAKIPTVLPIDFSMGFEQNEGLFLGPENTVPSNGLLYGTVNLSLLRGLLFDEQRYYLRSAELKGVKSQIDQDILEREVIYQAMTAYLEWAASYYQYRINEDYRGLVGERHLNVVQLYINGDIPAIDTLESKLTINTADKLLLDAYDKLVRSRQKLSLFIWDEQGNPMQVQGALVPGLLDSAVDHLRQLSLISDPTFLTDPYVRKLENEMASIELINRLDREQLKPRLDLKYNTIVSLGSDRVSPSMSLQDYKYGIGLHIPLLNRKTLGKIRLNEARIDQNRLEQVHYQGNLSAKYGGLAQRSEVQSDLIVIATEKLANSQLLYEAEQLKFGLGESSIFLLNQRETKLLEARIELLKNYASLGKILNELYYLKLGQN